MNNSPEAIIEFDPEFRVVRWSEEAQRVFGWSEEEIRDKSIAQMHWVYEDDVNLVKEVTDDMISGKRPRNTSANRNYRKDGSVIYCEWYNSAIYDDSGKLTSVLSQVVDVTERKQLQDKLGEYAKNLEGLVEERTKALKDAERLAAIGATAGMVGHDIRNPLQTVAGELFLAKGELSNLPEGEAKESLKESLDIISEQTVYVNKIVSDLQDYARPISPKLEEVSLEKTIQTVLSSINLRSTDQPADVRLEYNISKNFPKLKVDESYLRRILQNLVTNGIQAMPSGGVLTISGSAKKGKAIITVEDTGEGIPINVRDKLFSPLITTKSKGQGFGLAVVKRFTEGLGGTVTFETELGKGTKFIVELPS